MRTLRVKPWVKIVGAVILIAAVIFGMFKLGAFSSFISDSSGSNNGIFNAKTKVAKDVMNISLDEWVGWKPILDANGGVDTAKDSIYDKLGLKLHINIINDATQSSNAMIKGDLDGAGYTVNRFAFLENKFKSANVQVLMPYVVNSSTGGDGIIAKQGINRIEDLVGKKVGYPRFSEAQTILEWLLSKSSLTPEQIKTIRDNAVAFDTPDDAAKACLAGKIDAAATWQPYISQAETTVGYKRLFSTTSATNLVLDGVVFRKDYVDANNEKIAMFIEGTLQAAKLYGTEFSNIKKIMPTFATSSDDDIKGMLGDATLSNYATNKELLNGVAQTLFYDMANIWKSIGEKANPKSSEKVFSAEILNKLSDKFADDKVQKVEIGDKQKEAAKALDNGQALLKQTLTINFQPNLAAINQDSFASLQKFADTAKILNGAIIQIEGNTSSDGDPTFNQKLSAERAKSVANYLQGMGIDSNRFIIVGNGSDKPVGDNNTEDGKTKNRRTDIYFKTVE